MTWRGYKPRKCEHCGKTYKPKNYHGPRYCSRKCKTAAERRADVTDDELRRLVDTLPITHIAKKFGVSDHAVRKWCKSRGIPMKPRGYWQKLQAGKKPAPQKEAQLAKPTKPLPRIRRPELGVREPSAFEQFRKLWGM